MENSKGQFERRVSVSLILQLVTPAALILGSWINLQRQLDLVAHDVKLLLNNQEKFTSRLEVLQEKTLSHDYQLRALRSAESPKPLF
jgi:hypothetical protein